MDDHASAALSASTLITDEVEAQGIAADLIADLGTEDAIVWASEYMNDLQDNDRPEPVARWRLVTNALARLARGTLH